MNKHQLILRVLGQWWQMTVPMTLNRSGPMATGPNIPLQMMMQCIVVYDATAQ